MPDAGWVGEVRIAGGGVPARFSVNAPSKASGSTCLRREQTSRRRRGVIKNKNIGVREEVRTLKACVVGERNLVHTLWHLFSPTSLADFPRTKKWSNKGKT